MQFLTKDNYCKLFFILCCLLQYFLFPMSINIYKGIVDNEYLIQTTSDKVSFRLNDALIANDMIEKKSPPYFDPKKVLLTLILRKYFNNSKKEKYHSLRIYLLSMVNIDTLLKSTYRNMLFSFKKKISFYCNSCIFICKHILFQLQMYRHIS